MYIYFCFAFDNVVPYLHTEHVEISYFFLSFFFPLCPLKYNKLGDEAFYVTPPLPKKNKNKKTMRQQTNNKKSFFIFFSPFSNLKWYGGNIPEKSCLLVAYF